MFRFRVSNRFARVYMTFVVLMIVGPTVSWAQIEEVIVTTRKREENLQEVPIAVTALGAEQIQKLGINSLEDVVKFDPSVSFQTGYNAADVRIAIRGLSPTRGRANVAFLIDGIDITSENTIAAGSGLLANRRLLNDVERVEIIKGTQNALYGRAAFTGAISYTTKEPGDTLESNIRLDVAENGFLDVSGAIGGPVKGLEDILGFRFNGVYWSDDGYYRNSISNETVGSGKGFGGALVSVWTPAEPWKIKARVEYSDDHYDPSPTVRLTQGTPVPYPDSTVVRLAPDPNDIQTEDTLSLAGGYTNATASMPDHGLYCAEILPGITDQDARQLELKKMFPDYPTFPAHVPDPNNPHPDDTVQWKRALSDGSDPMQPGFCMPSSFGDGSDKVVTQGENPATGEDYEGSDLQTFRASLLVSWDLEFGGFTSYTGFTDAKSSITLDQDHRALGRPDTFLQNQGGDTDKDTSQFSQEIRFASDWDNSPAQLTLGGLYWSEQRITLDRNFINNCFTTGKGVAPTVTASGLVRDIPGLCDGADADGNTSGPGVTVDSWQAYWQQVQPQSSALWEADTEHYSLYGMFEFELAESWNLTLEDRWVVKEKFRLNKPNFSSCTNFAFGIFAGAAARPGAWLDESENPDFNALCTGDGFFGDPVWFGDLDPGLQAHYMSPNVQCDKFANVLLPGQPLSINGIDPLQPLNAPGVANNMPLSVDTVGCPYGNIIGEQDSNWHAPKITLDWFPTDDAMIYFSWARAIKPAGINQVSAGGAVTTIEDERFDAEIMDYWELGTKTSWEAAGFLTLNGAFFFQDYTDKQIGTQVLVPDGQGGFRSNPRVINASAAEVWGLEIEAVWAPSILEGLLFSLAYTRLDTKYTDFVDETTTFVRAGMAGECPLVWKNSANDTVATGTVNPNPDPANPIFAPKCALDLSGNSLEQAPENAFVGQFNLTRPLLDTPSEWFVGMDVVYQDERFFLPDNFVKFEDYWQLDFRVGLQNERWDALLYINNVLDDDTIRNGGSGPDFGPAMGDMGFSAGLVKTHYFAPLTPPRVLGVRLNVRFGTGS
jgi:outer membrane receptor protein involved in Fe transport